MTDVSDSDVINALRLGWFLAEIKGRSRSDAPTTVTPPRRPDGLLPLRIERSNQEGRVEAQTVLKAMAGALKVDEYQRGNTQANYADEIGACADLLGAARAAGDTADEAVRRKDLAPLVYAFDSHIQDELASTSERLACAYQLGRGLSESYWESFATSATPSPEAVDAWKALLSTERCDEFARLVGRIGPALNSYTPSAIAGSLAIWKQVVATDDWWKQDTTQQCLGDQQRRWYELLVLGQDPTSLVRPFALLKNWRTTTKTIRLFLPQLFGITLSLAAIIGVAAISGSGPGKAIIGALGIVGLSVTGAQAWIKNTAQSLTKRLHQDAYSDLIALEVTVVPPRKEGGISIGRRDDRALWSALRERTLTMADTTAA